MATNNPDMSMARATSSILPSVTHSESGKRVLRVSRSMGKLSSTVNSKNYTLNQHKALTKKLESTKRPIGLVDIHETSGGIVILLDTVTFEIVKVACSHFYANHPSKNFSVIKTESKDTKGSVVYETYQINSACLQEVYTVNLYWTSSKLLVNGKTPHTFIEVDLQQHILPSVSAKFPANTTLSKLSDSLAQYLIQCLSTQMNVNNKQAQQPTLSNTLAVVSNTSAESHIICIKCNRKCQSRAAFCEKGNHWIHYRCDRLTQEVIQLIESDDDYSYKCKQCPTTGEGTTPTQGINSIAEAILIEETEPDEITCIACNRLIEGTPDVCDFCQHRCHTSCMDQSQDGHNLCFGCKGSNLQTKEHYKSNNNIQSDDMAKEIGDTVTDHTTYMRNEAHNLDTLAVELNAKSIALDSKQKDLHKLELKLKKQEDNLKVREMALQSGEQEKIQLRTYIQELEATNDELQKSNRILRRRMSVMDEKDEDRDSVGISSVNTKTTNKDSNATLVEEIHQRITKLVLKKVDHEIRLLENCHKSNPLLDNSDVPTDKSSTEQSCNTSSITQQAPNPILESEQLTGTQIRQLDSQNRQPVEPQGRYSLLQSNVQSNTTTAYRPETQPIPTLVHPDSIRQGDTRNPPYIVTNRSRTAPKVINYHADLNPVYTAQAQINPNYFKNNITASSPRTVGYATQNYRLPINQPLKYHMTTPHFLWRGSLQHHPRLRM